MMRRDDIRYATTAFEAAAWQNGIKVTCDRCGHWAVYDPHALWWLCQAKGWDDRFGALQERLYCVTCRSVFGEKVRPKAIELTCERTTVELPMPPEREWKNALRRIRS